MKDVLAKFGQYRGFAVLNSVSNSINIHKFIVEERKHREKHKFCELKPVGLYYNTFLDSEQTNNADLLSNVLTPAEYSFFFAPETTNNAEVVYFSVHTEKCKEAAISKGYREIKVRHFTAPYKIPEKLSDLRHTTVTLPSFIRLKLYKGYNNEKFAVSLVRAFEKEFLCFSDSVETESNKQKASPCLKWTKQLRVKNGLAYDNNPFYNWCCAYYAVKFVTPFSEQNPQDINLTSNQLLKQVWEYLGDTVEIPEC